MTDEVSQGREPAPPRPGPGRHRRTLVMAGVVLAFLVVVLVVGAIRGTPDPAPRPSGSTTPSGASSAASAPKPLQLTGVRCAALDGDRLTIGFGLANTADTPFVLSSVVPTFPLGGFTVDADATPDTSSCPAASDGLPYLLSAGRQTLVALVLTPTDAGCVAPLPVSVDLEYGAGDEGAYTDTLRPFPDLGGYDLPSDC